MSFGALRVSAFLFMISGLAAGCVHHSSISQDYGLSGGMKPTEAARPSATAPEQTSPPPASQSEFRAIPAQKIEGATDPAVDDRNIQDLQEKLGKNPEDAAARLELAQQYFDFHLYENGLEQASEALRLARAAPQKDRALIERAMLGVSRCGRMAGRGKESIPLLEDAVREWPTANILEELGLLYEDTGESSRGEKAFREAVKLDPSAARLHNNLGHNLLIQNKGAEAEAEFRKSLELNPESSISRNNLGMVMARRGDLEGARKEFQNAADPATAHNNLAVVLYEIGEYEKSRQELVKALTVRPYFGAALANLKLVQEKILEGAQARARGAQNGDKSPTKVPEDKK